MSRNLLHKTKLEAFKSWLSQQDIEHRPGRGAFQVLQVRMTSKRLNEWQCVFDRLDAPEHYTVAYPLEPIVHRFIRDSRTKET